MAQLEEEYKQARERGMFHSQIPSCYSKTFPDDGEDDWGLSNPNHMAMPEEDCDSEPHESRE